MTTKRETILARIATVLAGTTGVSDRIFRGRTTAFARSETPSIVIEPQNDVVQQETSLATLDHTLTVVISVVVRSATPYPTADPVIESLHSRLMADLTLNGNAIDVKPTDTSFQYIDGDQSGGIFGCEYDIRYRTNVDDLTQW